MGQGQAAILWPHPVETRDGVPWHRGNPLPLANPSLRGGVLSICWSKTQPVHEGDILKNCLFRRGTRNFSGLLTVYDMGASFRLA
jgi:hypothetical protein